MLAIFDNEETGSQTKQGAGSPFLSMMLKRIALAQSGSEEAFYQAVERAFMISADNAHAWHPNYSEKYDPTNHPVLGGGPVIKFNAAQKYASDAVSAAVFAEICREAGVPCQRFVNHSDVAGGSTLGNILASSIPVRGVDMTSTVSRPSRNSSNKVALAVRLGRTGREAWADYLKPLGGLPRATAKHYLNGVVLSGGCYASAPPCCVWHRPGLSWCRR